MKVICTIGLNTFREILRDKILYGFLIFAVFFIFLSLALGQLSYAEQVRITASFGTSAVQLSAVFLSILLGSMLLPREMDKKTILTILVRPIYRWQFILGKVLGLYLMIALVVVGLAVMLALVMWRAGSSDFLPLIPVVFGILLESMVILTVTLLLSTFSRPILVSCMAFGIFLIGHWQSTLTHLTKQVRAPAIRVVKFLTEYLLPDLEVFNWKGLLIYNDPLSWHTFAYAAVYALGWCAVLLAISAIVFERKDLV